MNREVAFPTLRDTGRYGVARLQHLADQDADYRTDMLAIVALYRAGTAFMSDRLAPADSESRRPWRFNLSFITRSSEGLPSWYVKTAYASG
jgi:hypothetical protein